MNFNLKEAVEILERTPQTLEVFCAGLSEGWLAGHEGAGTWNVTEVIEHLIEAEKSNWMPRLESILKEGEGKPFPPFDRFAHIHDKPQGSIGQKLHLFKSERMRNLDRLKELVDPSRHLELAGLHPEFGVVKLRELLSTWVVHDFTHMAQIVRVMAERYRADVGPWSDYLGILKRK
ncbi:MULTISPECIES: DinB family protein [Paenibacillus]|uniref:DinB-like domain-containing protein n=1 Tax=Paenibacillus albilobatus TaxID=2716884 RepID=A0A919XFW6_9BACL|nr:MULTISPECIES: DinB family protein [Paenibacillus]GIO30959.1 hypothetical protein J2TS6_21000 [Paenibacillus albilobatus]